MSEFLHQLDDYLAGRLDGVCLERFEQELLDNPELQKEVRLQIAFREALSAESSLLLQERKPGIL